MGQMYSRNYEYERIDYKDTGAGAARYFFLSTAYKQQLPDTLACLCPKYMKAVNNCAEDIYTMSDVLFHINSRGYCFIYEFVLLYFVANLLFRQCIILTSSLNLRLYGQFFHKFQSVNLSYAPRMSISTD